MLKSESSILAAPRTLKNVLGKLDPKLASVFIPWACRHPRYLRAFIRLYGVHKHAEQSRAEALAEGVKVPPFLILSITPRCNLRCAGCYAAVVGTVCNGDPIAHKRLEPTLTWEKWREIIAEASELGVLGFVIAGGEPFLFPRLIELCEEFKDRFFIILTNGTTLTKADYERLKKSANIVIIVSIEGGPELTDARRGRGVHERAMNTLKQLSKIGVLTGISVTINRMNFRYWMDTKNIDRFIAQGIRIGVFIEYIPNTPILEPNDSTSSYTGIPEGNANEWDIKNDHALMLNAEERAEFRSRILSYRATKPIYIIHSPGDEEYFGGCVSAGRGFAHITPAGDLTPCPVSNIATHNLTTATLRDGLASPLFRRIRESEYLENGSTPCALFAHPQEVDELAKAAGAYRTGQ